MKIGFTGTRDGMTAQQRQAVRGVLQSLEGVTEAHHGDCKGADAEFHDMVRELLPSAQIVIHPPLQSHVRAFKQFDILCEPRDYLDRNHDIVNACDLLIATPKEAGEVQRSGTWATVRYARKQGRRMATVMPDGGGA